MTSRCKRPVPEIMKQHHRAISIAAALALSGFNGAALAQDAEHGERLSERWCAECHAISAAQGKSRGAPSFAAIAAKENVTVEMIAQFLRLPHATMPNAPLSRDDATDIAAFMMAIKK
jgi:mono/diheme cytochrome c family protein